MTSGVVQLRDSFQVNTFETGPQYFAKTTALAGGGFVVTWRSYDPAGASLDIYGRIYDDSGDPVGTEFRLNPPTSDIDEFNLMVSPLDTGGFVATWADNSGESGPYSDESGAYPETAVFARTFAADGTAVGEPVELALTGRPRALSMFPDGSFFVVSHLNDSSGSTLMGQFLDSYGSLSGTPFEITDTWAFGWSDIEMDRIAGSALALPVSGQALFIWGEVGTGAGGKETYDWVFQLASPTTGLVGSPYRIENSTSGAAERSGDVPPFSVVELTSGDFVIAWPRYDKIREVYNEMVFQRFDSAGNPVGSETTAPKGFSAGVHKMVALDTGGFVIVGADQDGLIFDANGNLVGKDYLPVWEYSADLEELVPLSGGRFIATQTDWDAHDTGVFSKILGINTSPAGKPEITGGPTEDSILTADFSGVTDDNGIDAETTSYQWLRDGVEISGATGTNHTLTQADTGAEIAVRMSYTDGIGVDEVVTSASTGPVENVNDAPSGTVSISGSASLHGLLTADAGDVSDEDGFGPLSYAWFRDGIAITGATAAVYRITGADIGRELTAVVSYTDSFGTDENVISAAVTPAPQPPGFSVEVTDGELGEDGDKAAFVIGLTAEPSHPVTLSLSLSDSTEGKLLTTEITFEPDSWDELQTVRVKGIDDRDNDGSVALEVTGTTISDDPAYQALSFAPVSLTNLDDGEDGRIDLFGDNKANTLEGMNGNDRLYGEGGDDVLIGNYGNDRLYGGYGDDDLHGGEGDDLLDGEQDDDTIRGDAGDDEVFGGGGADILFGGTGDDILDGGTGVDRMVGGEGSDTYYVDRPGDVIRDEGAATDVDTVVVIGSFSYTLGLGVESARLGDRTTSAFLVGNKLDNEIEGGAADDELSGGAGSDTLYAAAGDDTVDAGTGDDLIIGGSGAGDDIYRGGRGVDTILYSSAKSGIYVDLADGTGASRKSGDKAGIGEDSLSGIENIIGGKFGDKLIGSDVRNEIDGKGGKDKIDGGGDRDILRGGNGKDLLDGQGGNDRIEGGSGNDKIFGGGGRDKIDGGAGDDTLSGGKGVDTFIFSKGRDVIRDFGSNDILDLSQSKGIKGFHDLIRNHTAIEHGDFQIFDDEGNKFVLKDIEIGNLEESMLIF